MGEVSAPEEYVGHAVINGVIQFLSVSQIQEFAPSQEGCNRKWWLKKIGGQKEEQKEAAKDGDRDHKTLKHYVDTGENVLPRHLQAGSHLIPVSTPEHTFLTEKKFTKAGRELTAGGLPVIGSIDLVNTTGYYLDNEGEWRPDPPHTWEVNDWKTTKIISRYSKNGPALVRTVQMPGYAKWAIGQDPTLEYVRLSHVYFQSKGKPQALKSTILVPIETIKDRMIAVDGIVREMVEVAKETKIEKVPPNFDACGAYGGCPFRDGRCPRSTTQALAEALGSKGQAMSLLKRKREEQAQGASGATGNAPPANQAPAANTPSPSEVASARAALEAAEGGAGTHAPEENKNIHAKDAKQGRIYFIAGKVNDYAKAICHTTGGYSFALPSAPGDAPRPPVIVPLDEVVTQIGAPTEEHTSLFPVTAPPKLPPPSLPPPRALTASGVLPPDAPRSDPAKAAEPIPANAAVPANVRAAAGEPPEVAPAPPKKPRGRPPKIKPNTGAPANGEANDATNEGDDLILFVDCVPSGTGFTFLDPYIDGIKSRLESAGKADDLRCAPEESPLGFGRWKGCLAAAVKEEPPEPGAYICLGVRDSEIKQIVIEALTPICSELVRGIR